MRRARVALPKFLPRGSDGSHRDPSELSGTCHHGAPKVKQELDHNKVVCLVPKGSCTRHRCRRRGHLQFCRRCTTSKSAFHSRWTAGHFASFRENPRMSLDPVFYGISAIHGRIAGSSTSAILKSSSRCQLMGWACLAEDLGACAAHFGIFRPIVLRPEVCLLCG